MNTKRLHRLDENDAWNKKAECWTLCDHNGTTLGLLERDLGGGKWKVYVGVGIDSRFIGAFATTRHNAAAKIDSTVGYVHPSVRT